MSFTRSITRKLKDGTERTYYYRVEGFREGGKVRQRMVEYLGTNPDLPTIPLDPPLTHPLPVAFSRLWTRVAYSCPGPTAFSSCPPSGEAEVAAWRAAPDPPPAPGNALCRAPADPGELGRGSPWRSDASPGCSSVRRARETGSSVRPTGPEPGASYVEGTPCGVLGRMGRPVKRSCGGARRPVPRWGRRGTGRALRAVTASARPADDQPKRRAGAP